jgi:hypothetical protein
MPPPALTLDLNSGMIGLYPRYLPGSGLWDQSFPRRRRSTASGRPLVADLDQVSRQTGRRLPEIRIGACSGRCLRIVPLAYIT